MAFLRRSIGTSEQAIHAPRSSVESEVISVWAESAAAGDGMYEPARLPELTPNFLYDLLAPAWAEQNQLIKIDYQLAARVASSLRDDPNYNDDPATYDILVDRTIDSPARKPRLRKMLIDAINGLPDGNEANSLVNNLVSSEVGHPVELRPTTELINDLYRYAYGWGPLEELMADQTITEIMVNRHDGIFIERTTESGSRLFQVSQSFESPIALRRFLERMVEQTRDKKINFEHPTVDLSLPDGSRVNATIPPVSRSPSITIRRKRERFYSLDELQEKGSFDPTMREFIRESNLSGANIIVYGSVGSGKTTLLTAIIDEKPPDRRLIIIEDTPEINIEIERHPNTVWMLTNEHRSMRDLVRNALRMRPDHLILGETRDATAYDLIQAFNTGQTGSMSTLHARDPLSCLARLTNLVRQAEAAPTEEPARRMVADAVHLLIFAARLSDGSRRIIRIDEVLDLGDDFQFRTQNIFRFVIEGRDEHGSVVGHFEHHPDYVMGPSLAKLFADNGMNPHRWTGEAARAAGMRPSLEAV